MAFLVTTDNKMMEPNNGYYSKEIFLATHSSYILPKGSPLMVGLVSLPVIITVTLTWFRSVAAFIWKCNYEAEGYGDFEQVKR